MHFFFHHRVNLAGSCTFFVTTVWTYQAHALVFTTVWTYQTHALFFSPPCELIKPMHSSFHHLVNLSKSGTLFFTTVWTYQAHALPFHHRVNFSVSCILFQTAGIPTCILHMQEHCGSTKQWKEPGNTLTTKTMWYRNLAWSTRLGKISNQINLHYSSICKA